jgi:phosphonate transport system substrate-binding protein
LPTDARPARPGAEIPLLNSIRPAGTLRQSGFTLLQVETPNTTVPRDVIGYYFSGDEENTLELLLQGRVAAGGFSNQDFEELPDDIKDLFVVFGQTVTVPRQVVSVGPVMEQPVADKIRRVLLNLDQSEGGQELLAGLKTSKFDELSPESLASMRELSRLIALVAP